MRRIHHWAGVILAMTLAGGCGIRSTDVVEVGEPATGQIGTPGTPGKEGVTLYFQGPDGLMPVVRPYGKDVDPGKRLAMLLVGPTAAERAAGLRTELPEFDGSPALEENPGDVRILLMGPVAGLPAGARQQLVCTAASFKGQSLMTTVRISGSDGDLGMEPCRL
ncbi:hypothetical protein [Streptomyces sp. NPDC050738]|uniref:hypothetical protein n=1 Tax=Streptomyces sp. NPDC050738 TaxID=3154744 RepID=UPI00344672FC